jgi:hypothetical protein
VEKPDWLSLEFSYSSDDKFSFAASTELNKMLNPTYCFRPGRRGEIYSFHYQVPDELNGLSICVRANLSNIPYEGVESDYFDIEPDNFDCIDVRSPCSDEDRNRALASYILNAREMGNNEYALALADSLLETGWRSAIGLDAARSAANVLKQYQKALKFLDAIYETYKCIYPEEQYLGRDASEDYLQVREALVRKIAEQEQQEKSNE